MEIPDSIRRENSKTEMEIRKAEMQREIGDLKETINRTGDAVPRGTAEGAEAPAAAEEE